MAKDKGKGGGCGYAGRISNAGTQEVKAVFPAEGKRGKSSVLKGDDLRTGKNGK